MAKKTVSTQAAPYAAKDVNFKKMAPELDRSASAARETVMAIFSKRNPRDAAKDILGYDIVAATPEGVNRARITKVRSFEGIGIRTQNREGIVQQAGMVYVMKFRVAKFLNITTGREGTPSCLWIEEATNVKTGEVLKSNKLLKFLGLENADGQPILGDRTAIVPGATPSKIVPLSPVEEGASTNTTGIFKAVFQQ